MSEYATCIQTVAGQLMRSRGRGTHTACEGPRHRREPGHSQEEREPTPVATPSTPKQQLMVRKLAEADRRMREVTLQIRTNVHDKDRVRERKQQMLQGSLVHSGASGSSSQQQRSRSCPGGVLEPDDVAAEVAWRMCRRGPAAVRAESASGIEPARPTVPVGQCGDAPRNAAPSNAATGLSCSSWGSDGGRSGGRGITGTTVPRHVAASHGDRLVCTGTNRCRISTDGDGEDGEQGNAEIAVSATSGDLTERRQNRASMGSSAIRFADQPPACLPELGVPRMESAAASPACTQTPSPYGTPVRFGMDTMERKRFDQMKGASGGDSPAPASPLSSPVIRFGADPSGGAGFSFVPAKPVRAVSRLIPGGDMSPIAQVADVRLTVSTDYTEDYSSVRAFF